MENSAVNRLTLFAKSKHGAALNDWNYSETHPLGGSETAALYLARHMQALGYQVKLITDPHELVGHQCDIFVSLRMWQPFYDQLLPGRLNYLWCQDDADQPLVQPLSDPALAATVYNRCDAVIMLSTYQQQRWIQHLHLPVNKIFRSTNGIPLVRYSAGAELSQRPRWAYYASTPFRGLELLLKAWPLIKDAVTDAQLHIFSSMKVYNNAEEPERFRQMYQLAQQLPGVVYHGSVGQAELRQVSQRCRVLAYPNVFPETSCIAAMEAMASGAVVVASELGALSETAWHNPLFPISDGWLDSWALEIIRIFFDDAYYSRLAQHNLQTAQYYDWPAVARRWQEKFIFDYRLKFTR